MSKVTMYIATSKDGFIADSEGGVSWLDEYNEIEGEDFGYPDFYKSVDAIVMGSTTYEQVLTFGHWPYPDRPSFVFSQRALKAATDDITIITEEINTFMASYKEKHPNHHLWLMGGAKLVKAFDELQFIDELQVTIMPKTLSDGIPLVFDNDQYRLIDEIQHKANVKRLIFYRA